MINQLQLNHAVGQQPQRPPAATFRGLTASQGNQVRLAVSIQLEPFALLSKRCIGREIAESSNRIYPNWERGYWVYGRIEG